MTTEIFRQIALEIQANNFEPALWTRAFAECDGDHDKAKAFYIRLRHAELSKALMADGKPQSTPVQATRNAPLNELDKLRDNLAGKLAELGKGSFYTSLNLPPRCSDSEIADSIARARIREANGEVLPADVKYAMETLGNPVTREAYDRRLLNGLIERNSAQATISVSHGMGGNSTFLSWWNSRKLTAVIGLCGVLLFGAQGLGFFKVTTSKAVAQENLSAQREAARIAAENEAYRAQTQREAEQKLLENQAAAIQLAAKIALDREDAARRQAEAQHARLEQTRAAQERAQAARAEAEANRAKAQELLAMKRQMCHDARLRNNPGEIAKWCN